MPSGKVNLINIQQALIGLALTTSCVNLGILIFNHVSVPLIQSYILEPLALFASGFLVYTNHTRTATSSSTSLLFWPLYIFGLIIWGRTLLLTHPHASHVQVLLALRCAVAGLGLGYFALELIAPEFEPGPDDEVDSGHVANPIVTANIFSKWTFMYMTPLMKKGSSTIITEEDLPSLVKSDQAIELAQRLQNARVKQ